MPPVIRASANQRPDDSALNGLSRDKGNNRCIFSAPIFVSLVLQFYGEEDVPYRYKKMQQCYVSLTLPGNKKLFGTVIGSL